MDNPALWPAWRPIIIAVGVGVVLLASAVIGVVMLRRHKKAVTREQ